MSNPTRPLHEFVFSNRNELIQRCIGKVALRPVPLKIRAILDHGVPMFLEQLVDELRHEVTQPSNTAESGPTPIPPGISRSAALHGAEMLREGYSIDQVVHDYGDVCQSITELAMERRMPIETDDFRVLNRSLDNAIAGAVTAFSQGKQTSIDEQADTLSQRLNTFCDDQQRLVDIALRSYAAIKTGNVGITGATGALLANALDELRSLGETTLPEICRESTKATPARE